MSNVNPFKQEVVKLREIAAKAEALSKAWDEWMNEAEEEDSAFDAVVQKMNDLRMSL